MKKFAHLIKSIDETNKTLLKVSALKQYFLEANEEDKVWAIALLSLRRPKRAVKMPLLRMWAAEFANIPNWLFEETYHVVGDLAETIALLSNSSNTKTPSNQSLTEYIHQIIHLKQKDEIAQKEVVFNLWKNLSYYECFVFNKILTGGFRIGVSQKLMTRALAEAYNIDINTVAHRLMGNWNPAEISFKDLILEPQENENASRPYPFYLAYALENELEDLGNPHDWQVEWKWDGIRGQFIKRKDEVFVWSRGEELVTEKYPELIDLKEFLPNGTVIDGEIMAYKNNDPLSFNHLQTRIGRKTVSKKILEESPVILMAYDLLEFNGKDLRNEPLSYRRNLLEKLIGETPALVSLKISPSIKFDKWSEVKLLHEQSRAMKAEGFMLKQKSSAYKVGRVKGDWWKWKTDPYTIDAVLTYAMSGHGRRANLFTDYTFGLWQGKELITFAKAYSGLTDAEIRKVDQFVRKNTLQKFGPVRQVKPELVFEIAFEGIALSKRHKSGVAVRFPRILRHREDKSIKEANTLFDLRQFLEE